MKKILMLFICIICVSPLFSQERNIQAVMNELPDISLIGDFRGKVSTDDNDTEKDQFNIEEIELSFQSYLYPQIRADVFLAMHRHDGSMEPEICEATVSFLKLLGDLSAKAGKLHINYGKINSVHQHHRPYVDRPQVVSNFLGHHGLVAEGICLSYLLPLSVFMQADIGAYTVPAHAHGPEELEVNGLTDSNGSAIPIDEILIPGECGSEFGMGDKIYSTRLWASFPLKDSSELELGFSGVKGKGSHYSHHLDEAEIGAMDLTYKLWPSAHSRLLVQGEVLSLTRKVPIGTMHRAGWYGFVDYKFNKYWSLGARYDDAEDAFPHEDSNGNTSVDESAKTKATSIILTRRLTETTKIRFQHKYFMEGPQDIHEGYLQVLFGMGPHSHPLE